ncbi:MAG: response regulator [Elusimicrobia bacterium]|nr:response regulator [Elusimicrobiota bacterium]
MSKKILIVDDDADFAAAMKLVLESNSYSVESASSPDEGLRKLKEVHPDLILLDIMMGKGADGILFARKVRGENEYDRYSKVPILVLTSMRKQTGFWFPGEAKHPVFFPIDKILEKPVKPEALLEEVKGLLGAAVS